MTNDTDTMKQKENERTKAMFTKLREGKKPQDDVATRQSTENVRTKDMFERLKGKQSTENDGQYVPKVPSANKSDIGRS